MKLGTAIAEIMKREGIEILCGYPVNHLIEYAAAADIRPIMVRQERIGLHMADAISRVTSGKTIGAFCMQHGPGTENAYGRRGAVLRRIGAGAGAADGLCAAAGAISTRTSIPAMRCAALSKSAEPINIAAEVCNILRRAFTKLRNGRGGPVIVEIPTDMWNEEVPEPLNYTPVLRTRYGADPVACQGGRRAAGGGQAPGDLRRPGRALRQGLAAAEAAGRAARDSGHHQPRRQERVSRRPPAVAGLRRPGRAARGAAVPGRRRRDLRHRLLLHGNLLRHRDAEGQDHHPRHAGPGPSQQGRRGQIGLVGDAGADARRAARTSSATASRSTARRHRQLLPRSPRRTRSGWRNGCRS